MAKKPQNNVARAANAKRDRINTVIAAFSAGESAVEDALNLLHRAKNEYLERMRRACDGLPPVTAEEFERDWRPLLDKRWSNIELKYRRPKISVLKTVVLALTNGVATKSGETLTAYVNRVRKSGELVKKGLVEARASSGTKRKPKSKAVTIDRKAALLVLTGECASEADRMRRVIILDALTSHWETLEADMQKLAESCMAEPAPERVATQREAIDD